jgi:hypothetical protein
MPDSKSKMLSIRLSDVEYDALKAHYQNYGARNVSDLARLALHRIMSESPASPESLPAKLAELDGRVHTLECQISLLLEREPVAS